MQRGRLLCHGLPGLRNCPQRTVLCLPLFLPQGRALYARLQQHAALQSALSLEERVDRSERAPGEAARLSREKEPQRSERALALARARGIRSLWRRGWGQIRGPQTATISPVKSNVAFLYLIIHYFAPFRNSSQLKRHKKNSALCICPMTHAPALYRAGGI